ncbi:MAG: SGNH/GDSL hydrolase family protein, partial [Clostridia bacterium]|nr:SGNH/GDSL hydrolase family protein [Clostridia bacterium]
MKKVFWLSLICTVLFALLALSAAAETVYVKSDANGFTEAGVYAGFGRAVSALNGAGGTVVLLDRVSVSAVELAEQSGDLTITAREGGALELVGNLSFAKNRNDNVITIDCPIIAASARAIFGGFNNIVFTDKVAVDGPLSFYGGVDAAANATHGVDRGTNDPANLACITELPYSITVNGGSFAVFHGGNRRSGVTALVGSIAAPLSIEISGGTFGRAVSYAASDPIKTECVFSISGNSILADDATLTVNGGTFRAPIYAQGHLGEMNTAASGGSQITKSDPKYYVCDGDIGIDLDGGSFFGCEINAFQNSSVYTMLLRGNYDLTVSDKASLAAGTVLDATQVKAYPGSDSRAALVCPAGADVNVKRFDLVNGAPQTYAEPLRIACVGDSITEGNSSGNRQTLSYPAQLLTKLTAAGREVILGNYGCSATRVEDYSGQHYNDMLAYTLALQSDADYVIIGLGTNDAGVIQGGYSQMQRFYDEYTLLLRDFGELAATQKVFATTATHRPSTWGYGAISVRAQQIKATETLAKTSDKYVLIDLYALTLEQALAGNFLSSDDLHPHADGYAIYVDVLMGAIFGGVCRLTGFESTDIYLSASGTANMEATAENPTNSLMIALAKAAPTSTLHIIGAYNAEVGDKNYTLATPPVEHFTIVGEGSG